ncbi:MAG TPA: 16S rRNA (cytosine(967)-C(5))-methyltransferase RsmB [Solirubrobacteraceae bacterium]|nr:16S rRNA (cytosine(967)-C(5))-methyltransferase RsmB [Solirubrobacteraceae bacterium]
MARPRELEGKGPQNRARRPRRAEAVFVAPARRCAYAVIRRVFEHGAYADQALQAQADQLDARDRALAMRLAYGAIQRRLTLDRLIERLARRPVEQLDPPLLAALRLGMYELLYLSGAPDRAVVADCVELAKTGRGPGHGLVNAVLRRAAREGAPALLGELRDDTPERAAIAHSHPEWIARMWWREIGRTEALALMAAGNEPGELAVRVNTLRADPATVASGLALATHTDPDVPEALVLDGPFDLHGSSAWAEGAILAQSRAAMLVARVLDPQPGERILDLCAAPGGKSTHIAALMGNQGEVLAVERNPVRASELRDTARRLGASSVRVEVSDATHPRPEGDLFDRVLVDPPCSGLGTLQARPDLRWRVTPAHVEELTLIQASILDAGARALRPGGVLVYSTCTISPAENERQLELFLRRNSRFALEDITHVQRSHPHPSMPKALLTMPHRDRTAGFFIARMRRVDDPPAGRL